MASTAPCSAPALLRSALRSWPRRMQVPTKRPTHHPEPPPTAFRKKQPGCSSGGWCGPGPGRKHGCLSQRQPNVSLSLGQTRRGHAPSTRLAAPPTLAHMATSSDASSSSDAGVASATTTVMLGSTQSAEEPGPSVTARSTTGAKAPRKVLFRNCVSSALPRIKFTLNASASC
jgi:hypothetical protein